MEKKRQNWKFPIRIGLLLLAGAFVALGLWRGEADLVLNKAIRVCLECIGIG